jgi:hypothetical protein
LPPCRAFIAAKVANADGAENFVVTVAMVDEFKAQMLTSLRSQRR